MPRFTTAAPITADHWQRELRSRCTAAARLAMTAEQWQPEDRAEAAAAVAAAYFTGDWRMPTCTVCRHAAEHRAAVTDDYGTVVYGAPRCIAHRGTDYRRIVGSVAPLPTFAALYGAACNVRRTIARQRARDAVHAAELAARDAFTPSLPDDAPEVRGTPWGARRAALDMLRALGLDERTACRKGGPLWTAAYAAARAAAGLESDAIAAELELTAAQYRQHLSRAAGRVPSAACLPLSAHAAALGMEDTTPGVKATKTRERSADLAQDWRTRPDDAAPVAVTLDAAPVLPATLPDWTNGLPYATAARLARAAAIRRARGQAKTDEQRSTDRLAAGLPATVR